jgi:protein phosphatase 2C family protein 2/3
MEDSHAILLDLDEGSPKSNAFFAVYDGHGGEISTFPFLCLGPIPIFVGGATAIFAGQNVHKRLVTEETYHRKEYEAAMKRSFIGTDEDLLAGPAFIFFVKLAAV